MNIRRSIACMALMISTSYSSSMDPNEPYKNLHGASYTGDMKQKEFQKPGDKPSMREKNTLNRGFFEYSGVQYGNLSNSFNEDLSNSILEDDPVTEYPDKFPKELMEGVWGKYYKVFCEGDLRLYKLVNEMDSCQEVEYLKTLLGTLNKKGFKDDNNQPLTQQKFDEIVEAVKAKRLLTEPTLDDVDRNKKDFEIAKKIAKRMPEAWTLLSDELNEWELNMVNFVAQSPKYKDAIIKYSSHYDKCWRLQDECSERLTTNTFDEIVEKVQSKLFLTKPTLADVGADEEYFKIAEKIAAMMKNPHPKLISELGGYGWDSEMVKFIAQSPKYKDAIIKYSSHYGRLLDGNNKPLTPETFDEIVDAVKAKLLLTKPTLEDVGNKKEYFKIAEKIAKSMYATDISLENELIAWDSEMLNFIATNPAYKDAIIKYSANYGKLLDDKNQPLTQDTFDEIVSSKLTKVNNGKKCEIY